MTTNINTVAKDSDREKLLLIIAYAYQIAGAHDAPDHILDVLCDPEAATEEQIEAMLPYQPEASAATQQAGEPVAVVCGADFGAGLQSVPMPMWLSNTLPPIGTKLYLAAPISEDTGESKIQAAVRALDIQFEKVLCAKLGRDWSPTGISVKSLLAQLQPVTIAAPSDSIGSIGEDEEYRGALSDVIGCRPEDQPHYEVLLAAHIDRWASSRASQMEAAPRNAGVVNGIMPPFQLPDGCPRPHGDCTCSCHRMPGVYHIMPCCYPPTVPAAPDTRDALTDTARLDWFDRQRVGYGFEEVQEGNEWVMNGPFATLRKAIDECMKDESKGGA